MSPGSFCFTLCTIKYPFVSVRNVFVFVCYLYVMFLPCKTYVNINLVFSPLRDTRFNFTIVHGVYFYWWKIRGKRSETWYVTVVVTYRVWFMLPYLWIVPELNRMTAGNVLHVEVVLAIASYISWREFGFNSDRKIRKINIVHLVRIGFFFY